MLTESHNFSFIRIGWMSVRCGNERIESKSTNKFLFSFSVNTSSMSEKAKLFAFSATELISTELICEFKFGTVENESVVVGIF